VQDPSVKGVLEYTKPTDLKNISEFLGLAGWFTARGVSQRIFFTNAPCLRPHCMHLPAQTHPGPLPWYADKLKSIAGLAAHLRLGCIKALIRMLSRPILIFHIVVSRQASLSRFASLYNICIRHCFPTLQHDFLKTCSSHIPGHCVLSSETCEHWC
jgi:hypothetical protein